MKFKIKQRTTFQVFFGQDNQINFQFKKEIQEFDLNGNMIKEVAYNGDGDIEKANEYLFDKDDRLVEEIHYHNSGEYGDQIKYRFDEEGNLMEMEIIYGDGSKSVCKIFLNKDNKSIKTYDEDGEFESEEVIDYNTDGNVISETKFNEKHCIYSRNTFTYDDKKRMTNKLEYNGDSVLTKKVVYDYNKSNKVVHETHIDLNKVDIKDTLFNLGFAGEIDVEYDQIVGQDKYYVTHHINRVYDENGKLVREEIIKGGEESIEQFTTYFYNKQGLISEERLFTQKFDVKTEDDEKYSQVLFRYEYEFFT